MAPRSPLLTNPHRLRELVDAGLVTREIAEQAGTTVRAVRYALGRNGIPPPPSRPAVDLAPLVRDYAAGVPLDEIAAAYGWSRSWVRKKANDAGAHRPRRSVSAHPELADPAALRRLLAEHGSIRQAATAIGTSRRTIREALARQSVTFVPPRYLERWQFAVEAEQAAQARKRRVVDELRARGLTNGQISDALGIERLGISTRPPR